MNNHDVPAPLRLRRSPKRRALHERSHSHANELPSPTVRVIGHPDAKVYATSPFPTAESQVLAPRGRQPLVYDVSVSRIDGPTPTLLPEYQPPKPIKEPRDGQSRLPKHDGSDAALPTFDTASSSSPCEEEPSPTITPSSDLGVDRLTMDGGSELEEHEEIIQLPSASGGRRVSGRLSDAAPPIPPRASLRALASAASQLSVGSSGSSGSNDTVVRAKASGPPPRGHYTTFASRSASNSSGPRPTTSSTRPVTSSTRPVSSRSARSASLPPPLEIAEINRLSLSPVSSSSPTTPVSPVSPISPPPRSPGQRVYSSPSYTQSTPHIENHAPDDRSPIMPPSAASGSFARSSFQIPRRPVGANRRIGTEKWHAHLSTITSEGTDNRSSLSVQDAERRRESHTLSSVNRSSDSSSYPPVPRPAYIGHRQSIATSTIRVVQGAEDDQDAGPVADFRSRGSADPRVPIRDPNLRTDGTIRRGVGSRGSLLKDSIPAWARYFQRFSFWHRTTNLRRETHTDTRQRSYYAREGRFVIPNPAVDADDDRPGTKQSQRSRLAASRPWTRPSGIHTRDRNRDSMAITPATPITQNNQVLAEVEGSPRRKFSPSWSPHLWHDRRSAFKRRTIYIEPTLDEVAEGQALGRRNVQVWMFALGFIIPLCGFFFSKCIFLFVF